MNDYLKLLGLFGSDSLSWSEVRKVLELQTFLGLRHGCHSKEQFKQLSSEELSQLFAKYGVNISIRLQSLKEQQTTHRVSVQLVLNAD